MRDAGGGAAGGAPAGGSWRCSHAADAVPSPLKANWTLKVNLEGKEKCSSFFL